MLQKIDKITRKYLDKGNLGESFVRWWCQENNITYKKATFEENNYSGIDAFIENISTDIKNTKGIYFGRVYKDSYSFYVRHPFRQNTNCQNYLILDIDDNTSYNITFHGKIKDHLLEKYFLNEESYRKFLELLRSFDKQNVLEKYTSIDSFLFYLKKMVLPLVKPNILCYYPSTNSLEKEISIKLISEEDRDKESNFLLKEKNKKGVS